ncbi:unnamed protein product [Mucor hiemalis]
MIFTSKLPTQNLPKVSLYELTFEHSREFSRDSPCLFDAEDHTQSLTFNEIKNLTLRFGAGLKRIFPDFCKGDVVGVFSPNNIYYIPVAHGVVTVGGVVATIDHKSDVASAVSCLKAVETKYLVAHPDTLERAIDAARVVGIPSTNIFVLGENNILGTTCVEKAFWGDHQELAEPVKYTADELEKTVCYYYFTSGTIGDKKAVVFTHQSLVNTATVGTEWLPAGTRFLSYTELHHASSLVITMHLNVMYGCITYLLKEYTMEKLLYSIQEGKVNGFVTQPWIISSILKSHNVDKYDISSLKFILCSGAIVDKNMCSSFYNRFAVPVINSYGMTELVTGHQSTFSGSLEGNVGTLKPGFSCKIIADDGKELGYNQRGELLMKGPSLMPGYNNPELNAKAFDADGYFRTGDLFTVNEKEEFFYINRIKDVIKYKYHYVCVT